MLPFSRLNREIIKLITLDFSSDLVGDTGLTLGSGKSFQLYYLRLIAYDKKVCKNNEICQNVSV